MAAACVHVDAPELRPPGPNQSVYREDCTQCFDSIDSPSGLDVCLYCFNGGCLEERRHSELHYNTSSHPLSLNIKRKRKSPSRDEPPQKLTKLEIQAETESDRYDYQTTVRCRKCGIDDIDKTLGKLPIMVDGVMNANTFATKAEVAAWQQEIEACEHTVCLEQGPPRQIASQDLGGCAKCDLKENLWLCLACGNLGCGRAQFGGMGGNGHARDHGAETHHPVAVKLGSLTADGTADIYCYSCDEERMDPELPAHLAHWGINIADRQKTEKSLTELQIEQNMKHEFSMTDDKGNEMKPLFGQGLTGFKNLGNSCYMNSILQCLFDLSEFQDRYYKTSDVLPPATPKPADDLETQLRKIADGLLSGRYSKPDPDVLPSQDQPAYQRGLAPAMLKHLIGQGHAEFSTMRQQDAFEFLLHVFSNLSKSTPSSAEPQPIEAFRFNMEQKLQCDSCKRVRYRVDEMENLTVPVPTRKIAIDQSMGDGVAQADGADKERTSHQKDEYEPVTLKECLDILTGKEKVDLACPSCGGKEFTKQSLFKTFPAVLAVSCSRFALVNWVPTKIDVPVIVGDETFTLDEYKSAGQQPDEELLPEDTESLAKDKFEPNESALSLLESMGFPRVRCEKALKATGNADAETASLWLFEHMEDPDIDEPMKEDSQTSSSSVDQGAIENLTSMGFAVPQARQALKQTGGNVEAAVEWLFSNPDAQGDFSTDETPPAQEKTERKLFGSEILPAGFRLQSIVCHKGASIHAGHYVAFVRKSLPEADSWVLFNDEKVVKATDAEEMKKFAYVYFFRRV